MFQTQTFVFERHADGHILCFKNIFPPNIGLRVVYTGNILSSTRSVFEAQKLGQPTPHKLYFTSYTAKSNFKCINSVKRIFFVKPRSNALDFSLYIARQMSSVVECCREGVAKRSRFFTRLGTQHSTDVLFDE